MRVSNPKEAEEEKEASRATPYSAHMPHDVHLTSNRRNKSSGEQMLLTF
jgi:hypothetical protein